MEAWLILGAAVLVANCIQAATGFGSIVIAISIGALFLPIPAMLPVLVPLNAIITAYMVARYYQHVQWQTFLGLILPLMISGLAVGVFALSYLDNRYLKALFALLVIWFASRSLWAIYRHNSANCHHPLVTRLLVFGAGITHGMFASGGPLLVYGLAGTTMDKAQFRATLLLVWLTMNISLTAWFAYNGKLFINADKILWLLPMVLSGAWLGNALHHRIPELTFKKLVLAMLMITGGLLLGSSI
ncbi:hypothetical protein HMF8227_01421 [Saliniradius amylolyticus]|uniref:Probable membrane transporter protein n=1 Tax=Saliniradius amylolyticus TaxID=2183582 RepID=A0A2S2E2K9_9ALTE|nr:sulfite exporter TauE/SafE family protein [Saliniradius amylolyticus]AWL11896.1 hypothetical protein HMF8227_01421 [Saliniradius amylolyticus]